MTTRSEYGVQPSLLEPDDERGITPAYGSIDELTAGEGLSDDEPPRPINWNLLTADEAGAEWLDLNAWVSWLRGTYGLPPTVLPPLWHRHDELVWELSALHTHWLNAYYPDASASAPCAWHRDFADARNRLREWVAACGTRLDRDRPTRHAPWPGEAPNEAAAESVIEDRDADFLQFVLDDLAARRRIEEQVRAITSSP